MPLVYALHSVHASHSVTSLSFRYQTKGALLNVDVKGGGVTVEHNSGGGVISQTLVRSRAKIPKPKQNPFKLIPCRTYDDNQVMLSARPYYATWIASRTSAFTVPSRPRIKSGP